MNSLKKNALCAIMIISASSAFADSNQIDTNYEACIAKGDGSTLNVKDCNTKATKSWDKILNSNYQAVMSQSNKAQKDALRASQRLWIKFRNSEMKFFKTSTNDGTIETLSASSAYLRMEKERAKLLESYIGVDTGLSVEDAKIVYKIKTAFANKDFITIAKHVSYPLSVPNGKSIKNEAEFKARYTEIMDDDFFNFVGNAKITEWDYMNSRGIMFKNGQVWLNLNGEIIGITDIAKLQQELPKQEKRHPSAEKYETNTLQFTTEKFIIRVDETKDGYQFVSWGADKAISDKPDLVLTDGTYEAQGSQGGIMYIFKNGNYTYKAHEIFIGKGDGPKFWLYAEKDGKTIMKQGSKELQ